MLNWILLFTFKAIVIDVTKINYRFPKSCSVFVTSNELCFHFIHYCSLDREGEKGGIVTLPDNFTHDLLL